MKQKSKRYVDVYGEVEWRLPDGRFHRLDGPAVEFANGDKVWYVYGDLHRLDGPAVERKHVRKWFRNGILHRENGPAIDGDDSKEWYIMGKCHRLDGPAIEWFDGTKEWWVNDKRYTTFQSYLKAVKPLITEQEYFILVLTYGTEK